MPVISFDRDDTVETGNEPGPVTLEHIEEYIDHPCWRTYAHGNQELLEEVSGLTGMEDVRERTGVLRETGASEARAGESLRENRLRAIRTLESDAERLVVVDNVDLSHLDHWEYYFPSDFVHRHPDRFFSAP